MSFFYDKNRKISGEIIPVSVGYEKSIVFVI